MHKASRTVWAGPSAFSSSRPFCSTSKASLFFKRPPASSTTTSILDDLTAAQKSGRLDLVSKLYPSLRKAALENPLPPGGKHALRSVLSFLATTDRYPLVLRIVNDYPKLGLELGRRDHYIVLAALGNAGKTTQAYDYLKTLSASYKVPITIREWMPVLEAYRKAGDYDGMKKVFEELEASRSDELYPTSHAYNNLIRAAFRAGRVDDVRDIHRRMQQHPESAPNAGTDTALLDGFVRAGELGSAKAVRKRLEPLVNSWVGGTRHNREVVTADSATLNAVIRYEVAVGGMEAAIALVKRFRSGDVAVTRETIVTLIKAGVKYLRTSDEALTFIARLERTVDLRADSAAWSAAIHGLADAGHVEEALRLYDDARNRSIQPDSAMVQPLITALVTPSPTREAWPILKSLYEDLASSPRSYSTAPDAGIYTTLLRACCDPKCPDIEFSRTLIDDMADRGTRLDPATVEWQIIASMRVARDYEDAFQAYDGIRALHVDSVDTQSYNNIISAFTSLEFDAFPSGAPPSLVREILADMRATHNPPNAYTFSTLLTYYSREASASSSTIAHIHSLIKLDSGFDPDTALFNSLMTAYSRLHAFGPVYRIWESMRANQNPAVAIDHHSVSIIFDTCGFDRGAQGVARQIWMELKKERFPLNLKNYESYLECLCRMGLMDEAEELVFEEMGKGSKVEAAKSTYEVLLKFARKYDDERDSSELVVRMTERMKGDGSRDGGKGQSQKGKR